MTMYIMRLRDEIGLQVRRAGRPRYGRRAGGPRLHLLAQSPATALAGAGRTYGPVLRDMTRPA
ncbi:hypothetical protein SAMN02745121_06415 [Nannocystis exedens]|uniref:Uncharacterized protein n=1 Tax=Nannocystis exedens TaxID=54 RepID=A0A1I2F158_9BACT|nr:hypothetical protein [Nannocystis exedens]PCC69606.1 hypothetical protein NAEX_02630 [Nannocystis exedens]SFE99082.1 hypothetical protein SAMN02745121_06415 [Nannocystis exedens]